MKGFGVLWSVDVIMSSVGQWISELGLFCVCVQGCTCGVFYCV